jgi:hypothetical protein
VTEVVTESFLGFWWTGESFWCWLRAVWLLKERLHALQSKGACFGESSSCCLSALLLPKVRLHNTQMLVVSPVAVCGAIVA